MLHTKSNVISWILVALIVAMIALIWIPSIEYTSGEETKNISVMTYWCFPTENTDFNKTLVEVDEDWIVDNMIVGPTLVMLLGILSLLMLVTGYYKTSSLILPIIWAICGLVCWIPNWFFKLSATYWVEIVVFAAVVVLGVYNGRWTSSMVDTRPLKQVDKHMARIKKYVAKKNTDLLVPLTTANNTEVRIAAMDGLATVKGSVAYNTLIPFLHDPNPEIRAAAATSLGKLGVTTAGTYLNYFLDLEQDETVIAAMRAARAQLRDEEITL